MTMLLGPSVEQAKAAGRAERRFWAWDDDAMAVVEVSGVSTQEERAWWVPDLGYTLWTGAHLFDTREEAVSAARANLTGEMETLSAALKSLD
jgi:hypothetical protein